MLFAMSSPCDPFFLAALTSSLKNGILSNDGGYLTPVQLVWKKRFRKFSKVKL